jgi:hypothetical protein
MLSVIFAGLLAILIGAAFCFLGYRLFLVLLPILGFFAGFWLGAEAMSLLFGTGFLASTTGIVVGIIFGLILAVLSYFFYYAGVIIIAAIIGYALGSGLMMAIGFDAGLISALVGIVVAVVVAGAAILFNLQKYVIIILTSLAGANAILLGVLLFLGRVSLDSITISRDTIQPVMQDSWFWALAWVVIAAFGIYIQVRSNGTYEFDKSQYVGDWG